ncbi:TetR/AcrR family transcriptional regulator [Roseomonas elaeocarpi]|uniref:TetR/AcrR family transcriptional regulator n=1 Tax=Roseomonas elaeocarpi TaxID=907779 RepID=A0ABV6JMV5_9PROT
MSQPARRSQADRSTETCELLIRATVELLQSAGFAGVTTARVAARAGVTTGALHHHFTTKDDLLLGVFEHVSERVRRRLEEGDDAAGPSGPDAAELVAHLWEVYGDPAYWAIWEIIIGTRAENGFHGRVVADRAATMRTVIHPWVRRQVLSEDARPEAIALFEFMLVAIRGLSLERFLDKDAAYFERNLALLADTVGRRFGLLTTARQGAGTKPTRAGRKGS